MMRQRRPVAGHDERGAILPITVLLMAATMALASFVIDIGGDRIVLRDMQSVADVVALDLARNLDGRQASGYAGFNAAEPSSALFAAQKTASVDRQGGLLSEPDSVRARLAVADQQTGAFIRWAGSSDIPNAVRVWASGSSAFRIRPATPESTNLERSAFAAIGRPITCISAGATLADLTPNGTLDQLLGRLIGLDHLSLVGPSGLVDLDAQIPLGGLATQLGVGTVDQIATTSVTAQSFVLAAATVLSNNGEVAAANILNTIAARLNGTTSLNVGSILNLNTGTGSAANLNIDAFSFVQAVIEVSNKNNFVDLVVPVSAPGLASITLRAKVIEAPQIACGPVGSRAKSGQIQISLAANVTDSGVLALVSSVKLEPLLLTVGSGAATITDVTCSVNGSTVSVNAETSVGLLQLKLAIKLLLGLITVAVEVPDFAAKPNGASIGSSSSIPWTFDFPAGSTSLPPGKKLPEGGGALTLGLSSITPIKVTPLNGIANGLLSTVLGLVDGLVSPILNTVTQALGLRIGTIEVAPTTRPACNEPVLRD